jgi:hypothetical protein
MFSGAFTGKGKTFQVSFKGQFNELTQRGSPYAKL